MIFDITFTGSIPKINMDKFRKAHSRRLNKIWTESIRIFVRTLMTPNVIPVDTGMAKGSVLPLARVVKMFSTFASSINAKRTRKGYALGPGSNSSGVKDAAAGETLGEDAYNIKFSEPGSPDVFFTFSIPVYHWFLQEEGIRGRPGWDALGKAREAFLSYFNSQADRVFPDIEEYLDFEEI